MGLRGMQIEENAKRLQGSISGMQKQMETFAGVFDKLGNHLKNAQQTYSEADKRFERAQSILGNMLSVAAPGPGLPTIEACSSSSEEPAESTQASPKTAQAPVQRSLALPPTPNPK
jgi:DNA anti-recombination protein RmuC